MTVCCRFRLFDFNKDVVKSFKPTDRGLMVEFGQMV